MWVLMISEQGQHPTFYQGYDYMHKTVVQCDSRSFAKVFPSRTAAEDTARFHGIIDFRTTTVWG